MADTIMKILLSLLCLLLPLGVVRAEFALRDRDTLVFLGDSITAARGYTKMVENYTLLRFPDRRVRFINAGQGGDTAFGAVARLERDVFSQGATVVTVAFGVNDIAWGFKADAEHRQKYLDGVRAIVEACQRHRVRVFICSPAITSEDPDRAEQGFLQKMTDDGLALARSMGAGTIDLQRGMRSIHRRVLVANAGESDPKKRTGLHTEDGVHLNDLGQLAMGFALLRGLGAPAEVSAANIDAEAVRVAAAEGCKVSRLLRRDGVISFTRLDEGLPLNLGIFGALNFRFIPIPDELNRYLLRVTGLAPGRYSVKAEGRLLGKFTERQLAEGLNIASLTADGWEPGGPWDAQAGFVKELTDARDKLWMSGRLRGQFLSNHPRSGGLDGTTTKIDRDLVGLQRASARPYPYRFEIQRVD